MEKKTLIVTDKCTIAVTADATLTTKDIVERLNSGEVRLEAIRHTSGPDNERHWRHPDGTPMGRSAVRWAGAHVRKLTVEKGQSFMRNLIFSNLQRWISAAQGKPLTVPIKERKVVKVSEVTPKSLLLAEVERYMNSLKDTSEIGALWKFMKHLKK